MRLEHDPHPLVRGGSIVICTVSTMHILQASLLAYSHVAGNATPLWGLLYVLRNFGVSEAAAVPVIITTAALALGGTLLRLGWIRLALFFPQHFFLGVMALAGLYAASRGSYLDGTVISWVHILTDQLPVTALFIIHTSAIMRRAWDPDG